MKKLVPSQQHKVPLGSNFTSSMPLGVGSQFLMTFWKAKRVEPCQISRGTMFHRAEAATDNALLFTIIRNRW